MVAGRRLLALQARYPELIHVAMATPVGWRAFQMFCRGELSMARVIRRPTIHLAVSLLNGSRPA
jgi:hypothetical protein